LKEITVDIHGEATKIYETAYIHTADPKNITSTVHRDGMTYSQLRGDITLDIAFVLDTTGSMQPYIDAAKSVIRQIAASVNSNQNVKGRVRLALVGYRDRGDEYVSQVLCTFEAGTNLAAFEAVLDRTIADGGGDEPEQVFAGVRTAVTELNW